MPHRAAALLLLALPLASARLPLDKFQKPYGSPVETVGNLTTLAADDDFGYFSGGRASCTPAMYFAKTAPCTCSTSDYIYNQEFVVYNNKSVIGPCSQAARTMTSATDSRTDPNQYTCFLTERPPQANQVTLHLCHDHSSKSCCIPVQDMEIDDDYSVTLEAGDRCAQELVRPKLDLRDLFCFGCDPKSPQYFINGSIHICASHAIKVLPKYYDECGLMTVEQRGCDFGCDDSVMPGNYWTGGQGVGDVGISGGDFFASDADWQGSALNLFPSDRDVNKFPGTKENPTQWDAVRQFITSPTGAFPSFVWNVFGDAKTHIKFVEDYDVTCTAEGCTMDTSKPIDETPCFKNAASPAGPTAMLSLVLGSLLALHLRA